MSTWPRLVPSEDDIEDAKREVWEERHPEPEDREDTSEEMWVRGNHRSAARLIQGYRAALTQIAEGDVDQDAAHQAIEALQGRFL